MYYVGIDIAKNFHVVTIIDDSEKKITTKPIRVTNCIDGFSKFIIKLEAISLNPNDFIIGFEATGIYGENLWEFLNSHGFNVKLLNPFQTTRYREQHTMKKVKNDNIDSWIIALFLKDGKFSSGYVTDDEYQSLHFEPRNGSWTRLLVRLGGCLARSDNAAGSCLQGGATKPGARTDVLAGV